MMCMIVLRAFLYRRARIRTDARSKLSRVIVWESSRLVCTPESEQTGPVKPHTLQDTRITNFDSEATNRLPYLLVSNEWHFGHRIDLFFWHIIYQ